MIEGGPRAKSAPMGRQEGLARREPPTVVTSEGAEQYTILIPDWSLVLEVFTRPLHHLLHCSYSVSQDGCCYKVDE